MRVFRRLAALAMGASDSHRQIATSLYRGILGREPDEAGLSSHAFSLAAGEPLERLICSMIDSPEFRARTAGSVPMLSIRLPDLTALYPEKYVRREDGSTVFFAETDEDFDLLEGLIGRHRYYDSLGVWRPEIDLDKRVTAAIVQGLGAGSALEIGCFSGPVLSVLQARGVEICGLDVSHLAFLLADPDVSPHMIFGDLLDARIDRQFDVVYGMDILEHLNPVRFDAYLDRLAELTRPDGFVLVNSPMYGRDDVFGTVFDPHLPEWQAAGEEVLWRHLHCDDKGWPMHGHLVWAGARWWEQRFAAHGLVRDRDIEREIQTLLEGFFAETAPARKSLFVLKHAGATPDLDKVRSELSATILPTLAEPG